MHALLCFVLATAAIFESVAATTPTYSVFLPKYVRPGVPTKFVVEIFRSDNPVLVSATLSSNDFDSTISAVINSGENQELEFNAIPLGYDGNTEFRAKVHGNDSVTGEQLWMNETDEYDLQFQKKFISIFIQTDKAIYQPSHTIKFRAVVTTPDLLPYDGTATYKLMDPASNIIIQEKDAPLFYGVVGSEFRLGRYSTLGDWKITYEVHGFEESLLVTVEEYKLPKFKVEVMPDKTYLYPGASVLSGKITGMYTFGQPVKGSARYEITIAQTQPHYYYGDYDDSTRGRIAEKIQGEFDGSASFSVPIEDVKSAFGWTAGYYYYDLQITGFVTDKNTGDELNGTVSIDLTETKEKVEAVAKPENIKPGLPYTAYLKVTEQDGTPLSLSDREGLQAKVHVEYRYRYNRSLGSNQLSKVDWIDLVVGDDGMATMNMVAEPDSFESIYCNVKIQSYADQNRYWTSWTASRFKSPSNTFLQVSTADTSLSVADVAHLTVHTTQMAESYWIMVLARGKLIWQESVAPASYETAEHSSLFHYDFVITDEMIPNVFVVASFVREDGEVIGDSIKMHVQASLKNKVTITPSTEKTDAGTPVSITVEAAPNSFIGLRAIDQSVLLLKEGNDITQGKVFDDLDKYGATNTNWGGWGRGFGLWCWFFPISGTDVSEVFENSGVLVLTDALLYSSNPYGHGYYFSYDDDILEYAEKVPVAADEANEVSATATSAKPIKTRSFFPETWIWADMQSRADGTVSFNYNTPDTITAWELSSFAVSASEGLGVTEHNSKITVFRNFFISLNLPPSVVKGEILNMKTTLFNYFEHELTVTVTLNLNEWYDLIYIGNDPVAAGPVRTITIPSKDSTTVVFPIDLKKVGLARISVTARSSVAGDAVERTLFVKPEGIPKTVSHSTIIERSNVGDPETRINFDVELPSDVVNGSTFVKFSVSGNILGSALNNLGSLLRMPSGCGEQTMLSFAPDVFISLYLKKVGLLEGEVKQKSRSHIQEGYQNELRYKRDDGSFSAFGKSDASGSTWLTAFVVKCFIAATELDENLVERSKIEHAIGFIIKQQNTDGTFKEPGRVIHNDMQGSVESKETMAAYMLIAMAEGDYFKKNQDVLNAMSKAQGFLEGKVDVVTDLYTRSIMVYALALVESDRAMDMLSYIDSAATVKANLRYWEKKEAGVSRCVNAQDFCPFSQDDVSSSSIEITAYVLLTYVKMGRTSEVMPIVRWLVEQRGAFGGYRSTQDTVMAIQALSTVAGLFSDQPTDLSITVTHDGDSGFTESFVVNADNAVTLQMTDLPSLPGTVSVSATGQGFADVQMSVMYNIPTGPRSDEPFEITVEVEEVNGQITLDICSRINQNRDEVVEGTGMYVVSVGLPSGFTVDDKKATRVNKALKLAELVGDVVTGYFDELPQGVTECMELELVRYAEVSGVKPQLVTGFQYYKPGLMAMRLYQPKESSRCPTAEVCALCGSACVGCLETVDLCYDPMSHLAKIIEVYPSDSLCPAVSTSTERQRCSHLQGDTFGDGDAGCSDAILSTALNSDDGFTMTFLLYRKEFVHENKYSVVVLTSDDVETPHVVLEKKANANVFSAEFRLKGYVCTVQGVPITDATPYDWSLITIRFEAPDSAAVFVDGVAGGEQSCTTAENNDPATATVMHVGRGNELDVRGVDLLVMNLDVCTSALSDDKIATHSASVKKLIQDTKSKAHTTHLTIVLFFITSVLAMHFM